MWKSIEALAVLILTHYVHAHSAKPEQPGAGMEFALKKSRMLVISMALGSTLSALCAGGILMAVIGLCMRIANTEDALAIPLLFAGLILTFACVIAAGFAFSKKKFHLDEEEHLDQKNLPVAPAPAGQIIKEILSAVINDFLKESRSSSHETTRAAAKTPTSAQSA